MQNMKKYLLLVIMAVCAVAFSSCGKDDEVNPDVDLKSYIIGTWHSYRMTAYANGQYKSADITRYNEYSAAYIEMVFNADGGMALSAWQTNADGTSRWVTEYSGYTIVGNTVHISDSYVSGDNAEYAGWNKGLSFDSSIGGTTRSEDDDTVSLVFDPAVMSLYIRVSAVINGVNMVGDLYLKKRI